MYHYASGTPKNDEFQAIENQLCSHRLLSMFRDYQSEVFRWLKNIRDGHRTFDDWLAHTRDGKRLLVHKDRVAKRCFAERGLKVEWPGYVSSLREASNRLPKEPPRHIMLDSGAFTAWNQKKEKRVPVTLEELIPAYERFLKESEGLFDEVWLINLDVITDDTDSERVKNRKIAESDTNLEKLRREFGDLVLPVFHQGEGQTRLLEVIDQAQGYLCLSPTNNTSKKPFPEEKRWRWATLSRCALSDLDCDVRTHGLATTGNDMIRHASLYSGDSEAWLRHARYGKVDLIDEEVIVAECPVAKGPDKNGKYLKHTRIEERKRSRYRACHIGIEMNDWETGTGELLINQADHFSQQSKERRKSVRSQVEKTIAFALAQIEMRARSLVNLATLQEYSKHVSWRAPTGPTVTVKDGDGNTIDPEPSYGKKVEVRPYPTVEARERFLAMSAGYPGL